MGLGLIGPPFARSTQIGHRGRPRTIRRSGPLGSSMVSHLRAACRAGQGPDGRTVCSLEGFECASADAGQYGPNHNPAWHSPKAMLPWDP